MAKTKQWPAASIEMVDTATLKPYAQNAKAHSAEQIAQLSKSFDEYGWTNPVLVDEKGEIIAGHGRVMMAVAKGLPQVPVMYARGWTVAQKKAYRLFDNRSAELSSWDQGLLKAELVSLDTPKGGLSLTGFSKIDLDAMLKPVPMDAPTSSRTPSAIIQFNIVFDNSEQQDAWFAFVRRMKAEYAGTPNKTLGSMIHAYLKEQLGDGQG